MPLNAENWVLGTGNCPLATTHLF